MYIKPLNAAMEEFSIDTPIRQAAFLAQIGWESGQFRYVEEIASGEAYEGRADLGNMERGDGPKYKGRGLIQITGRTNYADCGDALGIDLLSEPDALTEPDLACRSAAWFWWKHGLNGLADVGNTAMITRKINGGVHGLAGRLALYERACKVLNVTPPGGLTV
jgi:putative chitinase